MRRQLGCEEQQDILRPYSTLNYAWDEPSLPHKLVLSLPGNRVLGVFELDKVRTLRTCSECSLLLFYCWTSLRFSQQWLIHLLQTL